MRRPLYNWHDHLASGRTARSAPATAAVDQVEAADIVQAVQAAGAGLVLTSIRVNGELRRGVP